MTRYIAALLIAFFLPAQAFAQVELSFYGGAQSAPASDVAIRDDVIGNGDFRIAWEGRPLTAPIYYGIRATQWQSPSFGYGLDFAHNKIYPQNGQLPAGYSTLEFTDGLNTLTLNAYRRWANMLGNVSPYIGAGLGLAIPHVEVTAGDSRTYGFQLTGPAATWIAGASYPINDQFSVFGEYKGTFSSNVGDLDSGGTVATDVFTNALNLGVSFNF